MRTVAILANVGLIGFVCYALATYGLPKREDEWWLFLFLVGAPIFNLIALFRPRDGTGWLTLFLKRKALEEQRKIEAIKRAK